MAKPIQYCKVKIIIIIKNKKVIYIYIKRNQADNIHPRKGVLKREVSKHQKTLSLLSLWQALEAQRAT